jgi:hypothetical protein
MFRGLRGHSEWVKSFSSAMSSILTDGLHLAGLGFASADFEAVFFCSAGFAGMVFFFPVGSGADFFFLGIEPVTGSLLASSGTWHLQGAWTSSVG